jgi:hypothetical protein
MRPTVRINDQVPKRAKKRAAHERRTLTSLVKEGLAVILAEAKRSRSENVQLPVSNASGGVIPGVDLNRSRELEEVMNRS